MNINTSITLMTLEDIKTVKELEFENSLAAWSEADYTDTIQTKHSVALVAKKSSKVIGFMIARLIMTESVAVEFEAFDKDYVSEIEIYNIAVHSKYRREGIGRDLISACIKWAGRDKPKSVWLEVRESNLGAIKFYTNIGFEVVGRRKNYYHAPTEDALIMCFKL